MRMMVRHIPGLTAVAALAVLVPGCASSKPAPEPEEERVVIEMPEEEGEPIEALEGEDGDAELPADDGSPLGVATCDKLIAKMTECSQQVPESVRESVLASIAQMRASWRGLAKTSPEVLGDACASTFAQMPQNMGSVCPDLVWE